RRIHNGVAKLSGSCAARRHFGMMCSIAVTSLAIDTLGHRSAAGIAVVAEEATIVGAAREIRGGGLIEAGAQVPAVLLRIPGERQLNEFTGASQVEVSPCVIARPDHVRRIHFEGIDLSSVRTKLVAALYQPVAALQHLVVTA